MAEDEKAGGGSKLQLQYRQTVTIWTSLIDRLRLAMHPNSDPNQQNYVSTDITTYVPDFGNVITSSSPTMDEKVLVAINFLENTLSMLMTWARDVNIESNAFVESEDFIVSLGVRAALEDLQSIMQDIHSSMDPPTTSAQSIIPSESHELATEVSDSSLQDDVLALLLDLQDCAKSIRMSQAVHSNDGPLEELFARLNRIREIPEITDDQSASDANAVLSERQILRLQGWSNHLSIIPRPVQIQFSNASVRTMELYEAAVDATCSDEDIYKRRQSLINLGKALNNLAHLYETSSEVSLNPPMFIIGAILSVLKASSFDQTSKHSVVKWLSKLSNKAYIFLNAKDINFESQKIHVVLVKIYGDMIQLCKLAYNVHVNDKGKRQPVQEFRTKTFWKHLGELFDDILEDYRAHTAVLRTMVAPENHQQRIDSETRELGQPSNQALKKPPLFSVTQPIEAEIVAGQTAKIQSKMGFNKGGKPEQASKLRYLLDQIPSISFEQEHYRRLQNCVKGTCQWFLRDERYITWKTGDLPTLFWARGMAGSGKSTLAAQVVEDLKSSLDENYSFAYVYASLVENKDISLLFGSILKQFTSRSMDQETMLAAFSSWDEYTYTSRVNPDALEAIFSSFAKRTRCCIVMDELDELSNAGKVIEAFKYLSRESDNNLRMIVFGRPTESLTKQLADYSAINMEDGNFEDILATAQEQISKMDSKSHQYSIEVESSLLKETIKLAKGNFLWGSLAVRELSRSISEGNAKKTLEMLPSDLSNLYSVLFNEICNFSIAIWRDLALQVILLVTTAESGLSKLAIAEAISYSSAFNQLEIAVVKSTIFDSKILEEVCRGLVWVDDEDLVSPTHISVVEFLNSLSENLEDTGLDWYRKALQQVAETCLRYLGHSSELERDTLETEEALEKFQKDNPFLSHAANFWASYINDSNRTELRNLIMSFINSEKRRNLIMQVRLSKEESVCPFPGRCLQLHVLSLFGLWEEAEGISTIQSQTNEVDGSDRIPLDYAFIFDQKSMCMWLLKITSYDKELRGFYQSRISPLHTACRKNWRDATETLLKQGFNPDGVPVSGGTTPLHIASTYGHIEVAELLLDAGADTNSCMNGDRTPVMIAAREGYFDLVSLFLIKSATEINRVDDNGVTALHEAVASENASIVELLLKHGADVHLQAQGFSGQTPLHLAAQANSTEIIDMLLSHGAKIDGICDDGFTPLLVSASHGSLQSTRRLLEKGANQLVVNAYNQTAVHISARNRNADILEALLDLGIDINARDIDGETALHEASTFGYADCIQVLLAYDADVRILNMRTMTALHLAVWHQHLEIAEQLLSFGADPNQPSMFNTYALHMAAMKGDSSFVASLIAHGANPSVLDDSQFNVFHHSAASGHAHFIANLLDFTLVDLLRDQSQTGKTPLHFAAEKGHLEVVNLILHKVGPETLNMTEVKGITPLWIAASEGHTDIALALIESGASLDLADDSGNTPLIVALRNGYEDTARMLLERGANVEKKLKDGVTVLHVAAMRGLVKSTALLLRHGCDTETRTTNGETPLYLAAWAGHVEIIDLLVQSGGATLNVMNSEGVSCFAIACVSGRLEVLEKLMNLGVDVRATDLLGRSALAFAVNGGNLQAIKFLLSQGISVQGSGSYFDEHLIRAVQSGFPDVVDLLLQEGIDIAEPTRITGTNAIGEAAAYRYRTALKLLLEAGADPHRRDYYSLSAIDYARLHEPTLETLGTYYSLDQTALTWSDRQEIVKETICNLIQEITKLGDYVSPTNARLRGHYLAALASALTLAGDDPITHLNEKLIWMEIFFRPGNEELPENLLVASAECDACMRALRLNNLFICLQCQQMFLCETCHSRYLTGWKMPRSAVQDIRALESLELSIKPALNIIITLAEASCSFAAQILTRFDEVEQWLDKKLQEFDEWDKQFNSEHDYDARLRQSLDLLKLVDMLRRSWYGDKSNDRIDADSVPEEIESRFENARRELARLRDNLWLRHEDRPFPCFEHDYLEISYQQAQNLQTSHSVFDQNGRLKVEWLHDLRRRYINESTLPKRILPNPAQAEVTFGVKSRTGALIGTSELLDSQKSADAQDINTLSENVDRSRSRRAHSLPPSTDRLSFGLERSSSWHAFRGDKASESQTFEDAVAESFSRPRRTSSLASGLSVISAAPKPQPAIEMSRTLTHVDSFAIDDYKHLQPNESNQTVNFKETMQKASKIHEIDDVDVGVLTQAGTIAPFHGGEGYSAPSILRRSTLPLAGARHLDGQTGLRHAATDPSLSSPDSNTLESQPAISVGDAENPGEKESNPTLLPLPETIRVNGKAYSFLTSTDDHGFKLLLCFKLVEVTCPEFYTNFIDSLVRDESSLQRGGLKAVES